MASRVRVLARVLIRRAVTTKRDPALLAGPQMNPLCADLHAFRTFANLRMFDRRDRIEMRATSAGHGLRK